jgi:hypothetical protein
MLVLRGRAQMNTGRIQKGRTMRITSWLLALLTILSHGVSYCHDRGNATVVVKYVNFTLETFARVDCDSFEVDLKYKTLTFTDSLSLSTFARFVHTFQIDTQGVCSVDSRAKIIVCQKTGQTDTICVSDGSICLNGKPVAYNKRFMVFLKRLLKHHDRNFHW